jgi:hypothetical protein
LLAALASGDAAVAFEKQSGTEIVARVLRVLKAIFAPQGVTVPQPVQVRLVYLSLNQSHAMVDSVCYGIDSAVLQPERRLVHRSGMCFSAHVQLVHVNIHSGLGMNHLAVQSVFL